MLILGVRRKAPESIPETGDLSLIGGFNSFSEEVLPTPTMLNDLADRHLQAQLGVTPRSEQCSEFLPCEYNMDDITDPLRTPNGDILIKRVAFERIVKLDRAQIEDMYAHFSNVHERMREAAALPEEKRIEALKDIKIGDFVMLSPEAFECRVRSGVSFPYEVDYVREAFKFAEAKQMPRVGWIAPDEEYSL